MPDVDILIGSKSDLPVAAKASETLTRFGLTSQTHVASAHRNLERVVRILRESDASVFIAMAGMSAALPGGVAAQTLKPVIGVPVSGKINLDAVLSVSQMPKGIPVASVALDGGENAALLAVEILALSRSALAEKLKEYRAEWNREPETP